MTAATSLADAVRKLNVRLSELPPEQAAEIQGEWNTSWAELTEQREAAPNDEVLRDAVARWEAHWSDRLAQVR